MSTLKTCVNCARWWKLAGTAALGGLCSAGGTATFRTAPNAACAVRQGAAFEPVATLNLANCTLDLRVITPLGAIAKITSQIRDGSAAANARVTLLYLYEDEQGSALQPQFLRAYKGPPVRFRG